MPKVSSKRQITLPIDQCVAAHINAGDIVETYVDRQGVITIIKKTPGAASGFLKNVDINNDISEQESLASVFDK